MAVPYRVGQLVFGFLICRKRRRIRLLGVSLCSLFILFAYISNRGNTRQKIYETEFRQTQNILSQTDVYVEQLLAIGQEFASFNIPYEQLDITQNYWARNILHRFLDTFLSTKSYINNIDFQANSVSLSPSSVLHEKTLTEQNTFDIYTTNNIAWPYYFDLVTCYRFPYKSIAITVDAYQLSKNIFTYDDRERRDYVLTEDNIVLLTNHRQTFRTDIADFYPDINIILSFLYITLAKKADNMSLNKLSAFPVSQLILFRQKVSFRRNVHPLFQITYPRGKSIPVHYFSVTVNTHPFHPQNTEIP